MPRRSSDIDSRGDTFVDETGDRTLTESAQFVSPLERPADSSLCEQTDVHAEFEDNRPTEFFDLKKKKQLTTSRDQVIRGSTIKEMVDSRTHHLSRPIAQLLSRAKTDLDGARIDPQASLHLRHDFEFDTRVGYHLSLTLFNSAGRCVEVTAEVDPDGKKIRRESMMARLLPI